MNLDIKKEFGAAVRQHRRRLGISQETLAEFAGLHRTYVSDVELGVRNPSLESISKLSRALGVTIRALFTPSDEAEAAEGSAAERASQIADILLVEDNSKDVVLALEAFKQAKLTNRIHVVRDGAAALDFLLGGAASGPRVVLLDLNLPKVHGMEVLRRIKADERTRSIRVIVLTVSRNDDHIREALRLGAEAYLVKPVGFQNFSQVTPELSFRWTLVGPELRLLA